jgi:hypothetical protein
MRGAYSVWVGRPDGNRPLGRSRRRLDDNSKMDLQQMKCGGMVFIDMARIGTGGGLL